MAINVELGGLKPQIAPQTPDKFEWVLVVAVAFAGMSLAQNRGIPTRQLWAIGLYILVGAVFTDVALWVGVIGLFAVGFSGGFIALANWIQSLFGGGNQLTVNPSLPTGWTIPTLPSNTTNPTPQTPQTPQTPSTGG